MLRNPVNYEFTVTTSLFLNFQIKKHSSSWYDESRGHHTATTVSWCFFSEMKCAAGWTPLKRLHICLVSPLNSFPKISWINKMFNTNVRRSCLLFLVSGSFDLWTLLSHGCHFWWAFFLLLNHKHFNWGEWDLWWFLSFAHLLDESPMISLNNFDRLILPFFCLFSM